MMRKDDRLFLRPMLAAIDRIAQYRQGVSAETFLEQPLLQDGVIRQLEMVGEAARNLSAELRDRYPRVPWRTIIGMRNRMIHAYFEVQLIIVWEIIESDLPVLREQTTQILRDLGEQPAIPR